MNEQDTTTVGAGEDPMSWVRLDDGFADHPKILLLSDAAFRLHACAMCWSGRRSTDGFIAERDLRVLVGMLHDEQDGPALVDELLKMELWNVVDGGWEIHDFLKYNPRSDVVAARKDAQKTRMRKLRARAEGGSAARAHNVRSTCASTLSARARPRPLITEQPTTSDLGGGKNGFAGGSTPPVPAQGSLLPDEPKRKAARQTREPTALVKAAPKPESKTGATWEAYAAAYQKRYGEAPLRNAKLSGQLSNLVGQIGPDAPQVAAFYLTHNAALYVNSGHSVDLLLRDCQKLRTEMRTGQRVNADTARKNEQTAGNAFLQMAAQAIREERKHDDGE